MKRGSNLSKCFVQSLGTYGPTDFNFSPPRFYTRWWRGPDNVNPHRLNFNTKFSYSRSGTYLLECGVTWHLETLGLQEVYKGFPRDSTTTPTTHISLTREPPETREDRLFGVSITVGVFWDVNLTLGLIYVVVVLIDSVMDLIQFYVVDCEWNTNSKRLG